MQIPSSDSLGLKWSPGLSRSAESLPVQEVCGWHSEEGHLRDQEHPGVGDEAHQGGAQRWEERGAFPKASIQKWGQTRRRGRMRKRFRDTPPPASHILGDPKCYALYTTQKSHITRDQSGNVSNMSSMGNAKAVCPLLILLLRIIFTLLTKIYLPLFFYLSPREKENLGN